jgi:hypothetical protein
MRFVPILLALVAGSLGCASNKSNVESSLGRAITATEVTETGEKLAIPAEGITEVDVNSTVILTMNPEEIRKAAPVPADQTARAEKLTKELALLTEALRAQLASLEATRRLQEATNPTKEEKQAVGKLQFAAVTKVKELAKRQGDSAHELYAEAGYERVLAYVRGLKAEHEKLLEGIDSRTWRVRASLRNGARAEPVHVPNYDALSAGSIDVKNKLVPIVDEAVIAELNQAKAASAAAGDLAGLLKLVETDANRRLDALVEHLQATLEELKGNIERLALLDSKKAQARDALAKAKATVDGAKVALESCGAVLDELKKANRSKPLAVVGKVTPGAKKCAADLKLVASSAQATKAELDKLANVAELKELRDQIQKEVVDLTSEKLDPAALKAVLGLEGLATNVQPAAWAEEADFRDRPLGAVVDTRVDLTTTTRAPGDYVTYQGLVRDRNADETVVEGPQRTLRVVNGGLHLDVSGALLFVQPMQRATNEDPFRAAPGLTAGFHIHCLRNAGEVAPTGLCALWNGLNPGLGAHVATLTLGKVRTDPTTGQRVAAAVETPHIGVAAVGQLFGDVVQAGGGYDFQAGRAYWFVGIGIQTLTALGFKFGI